MRRMRVVLADFACFNIPLRINRKNPTQSVRLPSQTILIVELGKGSTCVRFGLFYRQIPVVPQLLTLSQPTLRL